MVTLTFPDGARREYPDGISGADIAKGISPSLAKRSVAMALDGTVADLAEDGERPAGVGHRCDLRRHHHDKTFRPLDHRESCLAKRGPEVREYEFLSAGHNIKNAAGQLPGHQIAFFRSQRPRQDAHP